MKRHPSVKSSAEQFRAIAELNGDVAFVIDCASGLPTYISPSITTVLGYGIEEFTQQMSGGDSTSPLAPLCGGLQARLERFAAGDLTRTRLVRHFEQRRKDGQIVPIEVTSLLLNDDEGQACSLVGILRDISRERDRVEQQRRFTSMLNHEFRTPLSTIDGAIQRLEVTSANADDATRQRYRKIQVSVDRLIGMLDDCLLYTSPSPRD